MVITSIAVHATEQESMYLTVGVSAPSVPGYSRGYNYYFADSPANLIITVRQSDGSANPIEVLPRHAALPEGLTIHVATTDGIEHPEWASEMQITPFITHNEQIADSVLHAAGKEVPNYMLQEEYKFHCTIPASAAGQIILISATINHIEYGHLETRRPYPIIVVVQRSEKDRNFVWGAKISEATVWGDYQYALTLADSFIVRGYTGLIGLARAREAAIHLKKYAAALSYLDLCMEANGAFAVPRVTDVPWESESPLTTEEIRRSASVNQAEYQRLRNEYLLKIVEQQQQQK
jgi:hypothetical protein